MTRPEAVVCSASSGSTPPLNPKLMPQPTALRIDNFDSAPFRDDSESK
jgi:hypothetical protein